MKEKKNITTKLALLSVLIPAVIPSQTVLALEENEIKISGIEQSKKIHEKDDLEDNISEMEEVNTSNGDNQELSIDNQDSPIKDEQNLNQLNEDNKVEIKKAGIALDTTNFPDKNFRDYLASNFDGDGDNYLSQEEVETITIIGITGISDLTGIKLLTSLSSLYISASSLNKIDIRGMNSITFVNYAYDNPNLVELDLRECPNLVTAYHATQNETVLISAGMTQYIGCNYIHEHTGHIVIDLRGIASSNSDGSKTVDLSTIISPELLSVFKQNDQPGFDENTNMLTIPKNETSSDYIAGKDEMGNSTYWTFYTDYDNSENNSKGAVNVTYVDTEGNKISDDVVKSGNIGEDYTTEQKEIEGYSFKEVQGDASGKFTDQAQTVTYVYTKSPVAGSDVTAKYVDTEGNKISEDVVKSGNIGEDYTTEQKEIEGYTFKEVQGDASGKFTDQAQTVTYVYTKNPLAGSDITAKYVDTEGNKISEDVVKSGNIGEDYSTDKKEIEGYTFKEVQGDASGKFTDQAQTVTYIYGQNDETVPGEETDTSKEIESSTEKQTSDTSSVSQRSDISNSGSKYLPITGEKATVGLSFAGLSALVLAGYFYFKNKK
jgi:LPXTG-motif cell wall-anchored protein